MAKQAYYEDLLPSYLTSPKTISSVAEIGVCHLIGHPNLLNGSNAGEHIQVVISHP